MEIKNNWNKQKAVSRVTDYNPTIAKIVLNISHLIIPIKRQDSQVGYKARLSCMQSIRNLLYLSIYLFKD